MEKLLPVQFKPVDMHVVNKVKRGKSLREPFVSLHKEIEENKT